MTRRNTSTIFVPTILVALLLAGTLLAAGEAAELTAYRVEDFEPPLMPVHEAWAQSASKAMKQVRGERLFAPRFRVAYSSTGLYFLVECADAKLTTSFVADGAPLWQGDALGLVLQPQGEGGALFEYVFTPTNRHAVRTAAAGESLDAAAPRSASGGAVVQKVLVMGAGVLGVGTPGQEGLEGWVAELYLPFAAMAPVVGAPPASGDRWQVAFYRVDYDGAEPALWSWPGAGDHPLGDELGLGTLVFD